MIGFAFASRAASRSGVGTGSASAFAGVEPKKEERKLFFLGSIGAVGIVPAVRIGPPFSSTWPVGEGSVASPRLLPPSRPRARLWRRQALPRRLSVPQVWMPLPQPSCRRASAAGRSARAGSSPSPVGAAPSASCRSTAGAPASVPAWASSIVGSLVEEQDASSTARRAAAAALRLPLAGRTPEVKRFPYLPSHRSGSDASEPSSPTTLGARTRRGESAARLLRLCIIIRPDHVSLPPFRPLWPCGSMLAASQYVTREPSHSCPARRPAPSRPCLCRVFSP